MIAILASKNSFIYDYLKRKRQQYFEMNSMEHFFENVKAGISFDYFYSELENVELYKNELNELDIFTILCIDNEKMEKMNKELLEKKNILFLYKEIKYDRVKEIILDKFFHYFELMKQESMITKKLNSIREENRQLKMYQKFDLQDINFQLQSKVETLSNFFTIGTIITSELKLSNVLALIMENVLNLTQGEVGAILLIDNNEVVPEITWGLPDQILFALKHRNGKSIIDILREEGEIIVISNFANQDDYYFEGDLNVFVSTLMAIPLVIKNSVIGLIFVVNKIDDSTFSNEDVEMANYLSNYASVAINNARLHKMEITKTRMQHELEVAHNVQMALLPMGDLDVPGLEIKAICYPAREVGGDYFDIIRKNDSVSAIVIGDVSNKGVPASLLMVTTRSMIRTETQNSTESVSVITKTNNLLCHDNFYDQNMFVTLFFGFYDAQNKQFDYTNAGHNWPIWIKASDKSINYLKTGGVFLGQFDNAPYKSTIINLEKDDIIFMYTDGLSEERNEKREMFGYKRLSKIILDNFDKPVNEIMEIIFSTIRDFRGKNDQYDDMTAILFRVK